MQKHLTWVYKSWAVVSQNVLDTLYSCIDLLLKCDCWFGCVLAIKYSYTTTKVCLLTYVIDLIPTDFENNIYGILVAKRC